MSISVAKLNEHMAIQAFNLRTHADKLDDHEERIRNLEMKVWGFAGIGSAVAIIVSAIITKLP